MKTMYKLMIVDDEQIEREGMAQFIPWEKYDVELCDTAWNGVDALEKIPKNIPDIVLTDIKMPVMDGIELIGRLSNEYKDIVIIVLSGYGEFEYTSKAMEFGVRHYLLKPCDEEKIVAVLNEAKKEVDMCKTAHQKEKEYYTIKRELLPHAKEELFRRFLTDGKVSEEERRLFKKELPENGEKIRILAMKNDIGGFEYIEQFILGNILGEILGMDKMPLFTSVDNMVFFAIKDISYQELKDAVTKTLQEFSRIMDRNIISAVSQTGNIEQAKELYDQIVYIYALGENAKKGDLLSYTEDDSTPNSNYYVDLEKIRKAALYDEVLFEITLAVKKMQCRDLSKERKKDICRAFAATWKNYIGKAQAEKNELDSAAIDSDESFIHIMGRWIAQTMNLWRTDKEGERMQNILTTIYCNLENTGLNIQYMAKNILYMNEDYFGRLFMKSIKVKFSSYLEQCRIEMAKRLLAYDPDMKIATLTEVIGYPVDGQYFSKTFRKVCGQTPTEYREMLKSKQDM